MNQTTRAVTGFGRITVILTDLQRPLDSSVDGA